MRHSFSMTWQISPEARQDAAAARRKLSSLVEMFNVQSVWISLESTRASVGGVIDANDEQAAWDLICRVAAKLSISFKFGEIDVTINDTSTQHVQVVVEATYHKFALLVSFEQAPDDALIETIAKTAQSCLVPPTLVELRVLLGDDCIVVEGVMKALDLAKAAELTDHIPSLSAADFQKLETLATLRDACHSFWRQAKVASPLMTIRVGEEWFNAYNDASGTRIFLQDLSGQLREVTLCR